MGKLPLLIILYFFANVAHEIKEERRVGKINHIINSKRVAFTQVYTVISYVLQNYILCLEKTTLEQIVRYLFQLKLLPVKHFERDQMSDCMVSGFVWCHATSSMLSHICIQTVHFMCKEISGHISTSTDCWFWWPFKCAPPGITAFCIHCGHLFVLFGHPAVERRGVLHAAVATIHTASTDGCQSNHGDKQSYF